MIKYFLLKLLGLMALLVPILFKSLNIIESINATIIVITILLGIAILVMGDYLQKKEWAANFSGLSQFFTFKTLSYLLNFLAILMRRNPIKVIITIAIKAPIGLKVFILFLLRMHISWRTH